MHIGKKTIALIITVILFWGISISPVYAGLIPASDQQKINRTYAVPASLPTRFAPANPENNTYTIKEVYTFKNLQAENDSKISIILPMPYNSATAIQTPLSDTISVDHEAEITFANDNWGNPVAHIKASNIPGGDTLTVHVTYSVKTQGCNTHIEAGKLTGKTEGIPDIYLRAEKYIESDAQQIKDEAAFLKKSSKDLGDLIQKTHQYVYTNINYDYSLKNKSDNQGALSAITNHSGVCQDFADLEVALLRANGIPARTNMGYGLSNNNGLKEYPPNPQIGNGFYNLENSRHVWTEIYLDPYGWVPADPTFAQNDPFYRTVGNMAPNEHILNILNTVEYLSWAGPFKFAENAGIKFGN